MTKSQIVSAVGVALTFVSTTSSGIVEILRPLPPPYNKYTVIAGLVAAGAGVLLSAWNQSLSQSHVSIPVETAKALRVAPEQTEGK